MSQSDRFAYNGFIAGLQFPVGGIIAWPSDTIPTGWALCNGQSYDTTSNPQLAIILGGSGTLPDLRGAFLRQINSNAGYTGPSIRGTQTDSFKQHSHGVIDEGHFHDYNSYGWSGINSTTSSANVRSSELSSITQQATINATLENNSTDTETSPYCYGINWIIKMDFTFALVFALMPTNGDINFWYNSIRTSPSSVTMVNRTVGPTSVGYRFNPSISEAGYFASVTGVTNFENNNNYSIEIWIYPEDQFSNIVPHILAKWRSTTENKYPYIIKYLDSSKVRIECYDGTNTPFIDIPAAKFEWCHIVGVFNFSTKVLTGYKNGVFSTSTSLSSITNSISNSSLVGIGSRTRSGFPIDAFWYFGYIGLVRIYNYALDANTVSSNYGEYKYLFV